MNTTESVDSLYSSEARGKALASAGNRFVSSTQLKTALLDVRPLDVCRVLKEVNSVIDVALEFDGRHAESRLLEVEADPDKPVPNPYCVANLESLKTVVRTVLSSALEELRLSMPPDWEGSQLQVSQFTAAKAALLKRIAEEYPRRRVDFNFREQSRRNVAGLRTTKASDPTNSARQKRRNPRKLGHVSPESTKELLVAVLMGHHQYGSRKGPNEDPIKCTDLADHAQTSKGTASRFFKDVFGSHRGYRALCRRREITRRLESLAGDKPMRGVNRRGPSHE